MPVEAHLQNVNMEWRRAFGLLHLSLVETYAPVLMLIIAQEVPRVPAERIVLPPRRFPEARY